MDTEILVDESIVRRRGLWRRGLPVDTIRRVHGYTEENGRQALILRGRGLRLLAIPDDVLVDPGLHAEIASLLERLAQRGVRIDPGAKELVERSQPTEA